MKSIGGLTYLFPQIYSIEWVQHPFPYYNIQCLDSAQDPRPPADKKAYLMAMRDPSRYWEMTSSRHILGMTGFINALNQLDHGRNRFRIRATFDIAPKPGVDATQLQDLTTVLVTNGPLALFEYTGALPRAGLYTHWQVMTNDEATLKVLADPAFDPAGTVLVSDPINGPANATNTSPGKVEFKIHTPRHIELTASSTTPGVLLMNDHYDPNWHVTVDGHPAPLLRCNYIMRGVQLPAGDHAVVFDFQPSLTGMKISLAADALGAVLCLLLLFVTQSEPVPNPAPAGNTARS